MGSIWHSVRFSSVRAAPGSLCSVVHLSYVPLLGLGLLSFAFHMKCNKPSLILFLFVSFIYSPGCVRWSEMERERRRSCWGWQGSGVWAATPYRQVESPQNKVSFFFFYHVTQTKRTSDFKGGERESGRRSGLVWCEVS